LTFEPRKKRAQVCKARKNAKNLRILGIIWTSFIQIMPMFLKASIFRISMSSIKLRNMEAAFAILSGEK
jgi:hypothetical protein